nr:MAG TPA: hypothetical protein [Caudoviricetes sp.]
MYNPFTFSYRFTLPFYFLTKYVTTPFSAVSLDRLAFVLGLSFCKALYIVPIFRS